MVMISLFCPIQNNVLSQNSGFEAQPMNAFAAHCCYNEEETNITFENV